MTVIFALTVVVESVTVKMVSTVTVVKAAREGSVPTAVTPAPVVSAQPARKTQTVVSIPQVPPVRMMVSTVTGRRSAAGADPVTTQEVPAPMQPVLKGMISAPVALERAVMTVTSVMEGKPV
jgi:hypothetical protein